MIFGVLWFFELISFFPCILFLSLFPVCLSPEGLTHLSVFFFSRNDPQLFFSRQMNAFFSFIIIMTFIFSYLRARNEAPKQRSLTSLRELIGFWIRGHRFVCLKFCHFFILFFLFPNETNNRFSRTSGRYFFLFSS